MLLVRPPPPPFPPPPLLTTTKMTIQTYEGGRDAPVKTMPEKGGGGRSTKWRDYTTPPLCVCLCACVPCTTWQMALWAAVGRRRRRRRHLLLSARWCHTAGKMEEGGGKFHQASLSSLSLSRHTDGNVDCIPTEGRKETFFFPPSALDGTDEERLLEEERKRRWYNNNNEEDKEGGDHSPPPPPPPPPPPYTQQEDKHYSAKAKTQLSSLPLSPEQRPKATNLFLLISSPLCPPGKQTRAERRKEEEGGDTFVDMHAWRRKVEIFLSLSSRASEP